MSEKTGILVSLDLLDDGRFRVEPRGKIEAYIWLGCVGPQKLCARRLSTAWRWEKRKVLPFVRLMVAIGLFKLEDGYISAIQLADAERHPEFIEGDSWRHMRIRVFVRDNFTCTYCGSTQDLHCDHVVPRVQGGLDVESKLTTACRPCNSSKGGRTPEQWRGALS